MPHDIYLSIINQFLNIWLTSMLGRIIYLILQEYEEWMERRGDVFKSSYLKILSVDCPIWLLVSHRSFADRKNIPTQEEAVCIEAIEKSCLLSSLVRTECSHGSTLYRRILTVAAWIIQMDFRRWHDVIFFLPFYDSSFNFLQVYNN